MSVVLYTIAFDETGKNTRFQMAKILASSLLRTCFSGQVVVFHNSTNPMFKIKREGINEVFVQDANNVDPINLRSCELDFRLSVLRELDLESCDYVTFVDYGHLVLHNVDYLLVGRDWDLMLQQRTKKDHILKSEYEQHLINNNLWCISSRALQSLICRDNDDKTDEETLSRNQELRVKSFERGAICVPFSGESWQSWLSGAILSSPDGSEHEKLSFLSSMFLGHYIAEPSGLWLEIFDL